MIYKNGPDEFQVRTIDGFIDLTFTELELVDYLEAIIHNGVRLWPDLLISDIVYNMDSGDVTPVPKGRWI